MELRRCAAVLRRSRRLGECVLRRRYCRRAHDRFGKGPGLRVASRTSSIAIGRRRDLDVREIANRLGVSTVVEGTVRQAAGRLRVSAQLTNATDGLTLWSVPHALHRSNARRCKADFALRGNRAKSRAGPSHVQRTDSRKPAALNHRLNEPSSDTCHLLRRCRAVKPTTIA
jgi:hypothetical protein